MYGPYLRRERPEDVVELEPLADLLLARPFDHRHLRGRQQTGAGTQVKLTVPLPHQARRSDRVTSLEAVEAVTTGVVPAFDSLEFSGRIRTTTCTDAVAIATARSL